MPNLLKRLAQLPKQLSLLDKSILAAILIVILVTSGLWWRHAAQLWKVAPVKGGTYTEGIVNQNPVDLDLIIAKLTKIGLTYTDHKSQIHGALADHWEVSQDGKTYTFHLRSGLDGNKIAQSYAALPDWQNIDIKATDASTITINLKQPFGPFLSFTSDPVIDLGPYVQEKQDKNQLSFVANKDFILGEPNIQHIILILYPDTKSLKAALERQEIMGADAQIKGVANSAQRKIHLTKQTVLLFNQFQPVFKDIKIRQQIRDHQKLEKPTNVTLVTNQDQHLLDLANEFAKKYEALNLKVSVKSVNSVVLDRDILSKDDGYDMLLTDFNYGYDADPYPYWHSSQIIGQGKNYAAYNNKDVDKMIEDARQTLDQNERQKKYQEIDKAIKQDVPAIFYPNYQFNYTISKRVKGVTEGIGTVPSDRFTEVWKWYLKAKRAK